MPNFSGQNLTFGKIQKQIKCEMMNLLSHNPAHEELSNNDYTTHEVAVSGCVDSPNADLDMNNSFSVLSLESVSDKIDDQDDEFDGEELGEGIMLLVSQSQVVAMTWIKHLSTQKIQFPQIG